MNVQTALSSPRFNRILLWLSALVLAAGVLLVVTKLAGGGSDTAKRGPDQGFRPTLPAKQVQLKNAQGVPIRTFEQLDEETRATIRTFLATAVAREHLDRSWPVIHPSLKKGYTFKQWANASALPSCPTRTPT